MIPSIWQGLTALALARQSRWGKYDPRLFVSTDIPGVGMGASEMRIKTPRALAPKRYERARGQRCKRGSG